MPWLQLQGYLKKSEKVFKEFLCQSRIGWGLALILLSLAVTLPGYMPQKLNLKVGEPSPCDIKAPRGLIYESEILTQKAREEAAKQVAPVYRIDNTVLMDLEGQVEKVLQKVKEAQKMGGSGEERLQLLKDSLAPYKLSTGELQALLGADASILNQLEATLKSALNRTMGEAVSQDSVSIARDKMIAFLENSPLEKRYKEVAISFIQALEIRPNLIYDAASTLQKREKAASEVSPVQVTISQNEKIVSDGEIVRPEHIEALQKLGLLRSQTSWGSVLGLIFFQALMVLCLILYMRSFRQEVYRNNSLILLVGSLWFFFLLLFKGLSLVNIGTRAEFGQVVGYLFPVAAASMLVAILLDAHLAVIITILLSLEAGLIGGSQFQFVVLGMVSGLVGLYSVSKLHRQGDIARSSFFLMPVNGITAISLGLMLHFSPRQILIAAVLGATNGLLSCILTLGVLPFLENTFGVTTAVKLLELANPNHPLLKRLLLEAPGTYHHSILVANLAEAAANAVGADSLLARVGSYYHDVGKLKRPYFFIENQIGSENPHERLSPSLSALIISSHVKDGLELAREYRLPKVIQDIIAQHHGTSLITYFYHKALEQCRSDSVREEDFRYEGPIPQSKEAAIVMLADSVEAAIRSLSKPTPGRMEGFVRKIIKEKLNDGQLEASDLTFKDLSLIAEAFTRVLTGIFHPRMEYPDIVMLKELERGKARDEMSNKQSAG